MSTSARPTSGATRAPGERDAQDKDALARLLGWFSLGLGIPQTVMPGAFCRAIGVRADRRSRMWTRIVGVRELAAAAGILSRPRPAGWVWSRVAGDAKDLTLLSVALATKREQPGRILGAMGAVCGIAATDLFEAVRLSRPPQKRAAQEDGAVHVRTAVTVRKPVEEVYRFWHDFENLPRFMAHLESVQMQGDGRSHWIAKGPAGRKVQWDAEVVEDRANERIAWRSLERADVPNSGSVQFTPAPGDRGTEIHLDMRYQPPAGVVGATVAKLFGEEPELQANDDLRRFKQVAETGGLVRSEGTPEGTHTRRLLRQRPAQPLPEHAGAGH